MGKRSFKNIDILLHILKPREYTLFNVMHEPENKFYFYYLMIHRKRDWGGGRLGLIELYYDIKNH